MRNGLWARGQPASRPRAEGGQDRHRRGRSQISGRGTDITELHTRGMQPASTRLGARKASEMVITPSPAATANFWLRTLRPAHLRLVQVAKACCLDDHGIQASSQGSQRGVACSLQFPDRRRQVGSARGHTTFQIKHYANWAKREYGTARV